MIARGIICAFAMARPARPRHEAMLVLAAADRLRDERGPVSARQAARKIAARVIEHVCAAFDAPEDAVDLRLGAILGLEIETLAVDPDIDTQALVREARRKRLEARGFRRLPAFEQGREDMQIRAAAAVTLARRYREFLKGWTKTAIYGHPQAR